VGGIEPAPFPIQTPFGTRIVRQKVDLDEETLMKVAGIGEGQYFRAADTDRLQEIYAIIDEQEKTEINVKEFFHFKELYPFFLIPAILFLVADIIVRATFLRTIP
jgi:Ca-activated chloride channel family protein